MPPHTSRLSHILLFKICWKYDGHVRYAIAGLRSCRSEYRTVQYVALVADCNRREMNRMLIDVKRQSPRLRASQRHTCYRDRNIGPLSRSQELLSRRFQYDALGLSTGSRLCRGRRHNCTRSETKKYNETGKFFLGVGSGYGG